MNNLLVGSKCHLSNGSFLINAEDELLEISIQDEVNVYLFNQNIRNLVLNVSDHSVINFYQYNDNLINDLKITINQNNNSVVNFNASFKNEANILVKLDNYINGNNNSSNIKFRNISNCEYSKMNINVYVKSKTKNNVALEDLRGITNGGNVEIEPNIICESNETIANHLTTIGVINREEIDYLMQKGISKEIAKQILLNSFIISNMNINMKNLIGGDQNA